MGIKTEIVSKKHFIGHFSVTVVSLAPRNYSFALNCISSDMVPLELPVAFIIGPHDYAYDPDGFHRYCVRMSAMTTQELNKLDGLNQIEYLKCTKLAEAGVSADAEVKLAEGKRQAQLYEEQKRAEGIAAVASAQSEALTNFLKLNDPDMIKYFLALERDLYPAMAEKTAEAIRGLNPKINIWNTDGQSCESNEYYSPVCCQCWMRCNRKQDSNCLVESLSQINDYFNNHFPFQHSIQLKCGRKCKCNITFAKFC